MKTRTIYLFFIAFLLVSCFNSCKKYTEDIVCNPTSDYYFNGLIANNQECWNSGENDYQVYHGWGSSTVSGVTSYHWSLGLDQWPIPEDNKTVFLEFEVPYNIDSCTSKQFQNTFKTGSYSFSPINNDSKSGIEMSYMEDGKYYRTTYGSQDDSYLNCTNVVESENYGNREVLDITWSFKCSLYGSNGTFYKEIQNAELRVSVLHANN